jgi:AraC-like DNA-binding protein/ligand-binding sensor protein
MILSANAKLIKALAGSGLFQSYERAYSEMTGLPLTLRAIENWQLPFRGKPTENAFCALTAGKSRSCAACLRLQGQLTLAAMELPATRNCAYGLCETAVPVKIGATTIGFLQTGQVMAHTPNAASFRRAVVQAGKFGMDLNDAAIRRAYFQTPVRTRKRLHATADLLVIFAQHLALKGNELMVQTANAEPARIRAAKAFILAHLAESISLRLVASAVNMSSFYFCKQFRKATGLGFTEFVARTRIEKAKHALLNPNLRVSEVAFTVGFQSLTHFNRVFKKLVGQSPSHFRGRVATA